MLVYDPRHVLARIYKHLSANQRLLLRRTDTPKQRYYCRTLWGYKWVGSPSRATIFRSADEIINEVAETWVWYESTFLVEDHTHLT